MATTGTALTVDDVVARLRAVASEQLATIHARRNPGLRTDGEPHADSEGIVKQIGCDSLPEKRPTTRKPNARRAA